MSWNKPQLALCHIAQQQLGWHDPQYRLVLANVAGIRQFHGKVSGTNPSADNAGFERFMAFCEQQGFVDLKHGRGYWTAQAAKQRARIHYKIQEVYDRGRRHGLFNSPDHALGGFVARQTADRPIEQGGPTRNLDECDAVYSFKVLEGLKAWIWREARNRGITLT